MILYRPVGLQELDLIYDGDMKAFPARLPKQPIFYPVLDLEYARHTASDWNIKNGQFAGYVTQFKVEEQYINQFEEHIVGKTQYQEFWIPAEEMEEFNRHIIGHIKVVEAYFGKAFQGYIPDKHGLQGKDAVAQFTLLANSYVYKRMDFYLEIKRNHKAIFLNYPFWLKHDFKNQALKEKVLQGIKEAWLTSFPKNPLMNPVAEDVLPAKKTDTPPLVDTVNQRNRHVKQSVPKPLVNSHEEEFDPDEQSDPDSSKNSPDEETKLEKQTNEDLIVDPVRNDISPAKQINSPSSVSPVPEEPPPIRKSTSFSPLNPVHRDATPIQPAVTHFTQGIKHGLNEQYQEAADELSKAVEEKPNQSIAQVSLGVAYHRLGENDRALVCYETALKIDPKSAEAHYFRANILYSLGKVREAITGYTTAIGLQPELIEAHQKSHPEDRLTDYSPTPAEIYSIARPARRILDLNQLLKTNPRQASLFKDRADAYSRLWNYEQAITDYNSSLAIQPDDARTLYLRGQAYEQIGQLDRALQDYQKAIAIDPQLSDEYFNRGVTFGKMGNYRQSIVSLTEGIRLAPANPSGYFNRGMTYLQIGDFEKAIDDFSMVIQLASNDEAAYYWRGISNEESGRQVDAIADYRQFLELSQDPNTRAEVEQRLSQLDVSEEKREGSLGSFWKGLLKSKQIQQEAEEQRVDLYGLIVALGERAIQSTWFGTGVDCDGEKAEELYASIDDSKPIDGDNFLQIAFGIRQILAGDFQAFDQGAKTPWIFIRAWEGSGFYIETDDPRITNHLKTQFRSVEEVQDVPPPYEGIFINISSPS